MSVAESDMQAPPAAAAETDAAAWPHPARAWWGVIVLMIGLTICFIDRNILTLLVEPIKADLRLTDTQMSLILGAAFMIFYAIAAIPIARLADTYSRRAVIGLSIAFWSLATAAGGMASSFWQLFAARAAVGIGESAFAPASYAILADSFPKEKLSRAIATLHLGLSFGAGFALLFGAGVIAFFERISPITLPLLGEVRAWQAVLVTVGLPGLIVAALMATVQEPTRRGRISTADGSGARRAIPPKEIAGFLYKERRTFAPLFAANATATLISAGVGAWVPTLFIRTYGWSMPQAAFAVGIVTLVTFPLGLFGGSLLSEFLRRRGCRDAELRAALIGFAGLVPLSILFPLLNNPNVALSVLGLSMFMGALHSAPSAAAMQLITPNEMRSQVRALLHVFVGVVGAGLGPIVVALFTDYLFGGDSHLRFSMALAVGLLGPFAIFCSWYVLRPYAESLERARTFAS
ncbi:MAG: MFS transporter [Hyphomonadaceae bacterium]|nr:MFS transporter [Hyphomonadaceae bacterium]